MHHAHGCGNPCLANTFVTRACLFACAWRVQRFAEIGMKAAISAVQFERLDNDRDGAIELGDLVQTFARIKGITFEQAYAVAHIVASRADTENKEAAAMKKGRGGLFGRLRGKASSTAETQVAPEPAAVGSDGIDFGEFLVAREGGGMIKFEKFLNIATTMLNKGQAGKGEADDVLKAECRRLFDAAKDQQKVTAQAKLA